MPRLGSAWGLLWLITAAPAARGLEGERAGLALAAWAEFATAVLLADADIALVSVGVRRAAFIPAAD